MDIPRSRKNAWLRDELILALALYRRHGRNPSVEELARVSSLLRAIPIEESLAHTSLSFRNVRSVALKVDNFVALDPSEPVAGMTRGGRADKEIWDEFTDAKGLLLRTSDAIERHIAAGPSLLEGFPPMIEAVEGRLLVQAHLVRERNATLVLSKKLTAAKPRLECEACGFDFQSAYGVRGAGFIECHHLTPLSDLSPGTRTRASDLALLCANCHRMIHRHRPWLSLAELKQLLEGSADSP